MFILIPTDLGLWLQVAGPFGLLFDFVEMEAGRMELRRIQMHKAIGHSIC